MPIVLRLALLLDLMAIWCETIVPSLHSVLPIAGSQFAQLAVFVLGATIALELYAISKPFLAPISGLVVMLVKRNKAN